MKLRRLAASLVLCVVLLLATRAAASPQPGHESFTFVPANAPVAVYIDTAGMLAVPGMRDTIQRGLRPSGLVSFDWNSLSNLTLGGIPDASAPAGLGFVLSVQGKRPLESLESALTTSPQWSQKVVGGNSYWAGIGPEHSLFSKDRTRFVLGTSQGIVDTSVAAGRSGSNVTRAAGFRPGGGAVGRTLIYLYYNGRSLPPHLHGMVQMGVSAGVSQSGLQQGIRDPKLRAQIVDLAGHTGRAKAIDFSMGRVAGNDAISTIHLRVAFATAADCQFARATFDNIADYYTRENIGLSIAMRAMSVTANGDRFSITINAPSEMVNSVMLMFVQGAAMAL